MRVLKAMQRLHDDAVTDRLKAGGARFMVLTILGGRIPIVLYTDGSKRK
jgi:hypothetical protein